MKKTMKAVAALMLMTAVVIAAGCKKNDDLGEINGGGNNGGGLNGHEYVDLGLPSGTLWATCNVGATTPEEYGDYFAWGETKPKESYYWNTYKYCNGEYQFTKYCNEASIGYNGFTDGLTILESDDDAATVNWGMEWHIPSPSEWRELVRYCTATWVSQNGVNGKLYTAANGASIFLPAAGGRFGVALFVAGEEGNYWTNTLDSGGSDYAYYFGNPAHGGDVWQVDNGSRIVGISIRPVRSAK